MTYSQQQQYFLDRLAQGSNIFLTGKAGTGKSFIVKEGFKELTARGKKYIALAPTGISANNICGQTLHSFFNLTPFGVLDYEACSFLKSEKRRLINAIDVIFIDEVSMFRPDIFDAINYTLIKNGCKKITEFQFVLIGDLKQLPAPISDNMRSILLQQYDGCEFYDAKVYGRLNFETIELTEVLRQSDEEFIHHLNIVRDGGKSEYFRQFVSKDAKGIVLAPHNSTVAKYNAEGLRQLTGEEIIFTAQITGNTKADDFNMESEIKVKDGAKIMYLCNSKDNNLVNGTLGIFRVDRDIYFIDVNDVYYAIEPVTHTKKEYVLNEKKDCLELKEIGSITQMPVKLAYALTIHKSQGLTFDNITIDLTLPCFSKGQVYTALSRVRTPQGLTIITR